MPIHIFQLLKYDLHVFQVNVFLDNYMASFTSFSFISDILPLERITLTGDIPKLSKSLCFCPISSVALKFLEIRFASIMLEVSVIPWYVEAYFIPSAVGRWYCRRTSPTSNNPYSSSLLDQSGIFDDV